MVDGFARFMKVLTFAASAGALFLSFDYMRETKSQKFEYPVLVLLATAGMGMMISANDLIALYLGLELQSLAQLCEVASLYRRVPEYHRGRSRERHVFENRFDNTRMGEEAFQTIATLIEMHDEIRLQDNARA